MVVNGKVGAKIFWALAGISIYFTVGASIPIWMLLRAAEAAAQGAVSDGLAWKAVLILLVVLAVGLVLSGMIAAGLKRTMTEPLVQIGKASQQVAKGDLKCKLDCGNDVDDEVRNLVKSHNVAVGKLGIIVNELDVALDKMAKGDYNVLLGKEFTGDFAKLKQSVERCTREMKHTMNGIQNSTQSAERAAKAKLSGLPKTTPTTVGTMKATGLPKASSTQSVASKTSGNREFMYGLDKY